MPSASAYSILSKADCIRTDRIEYNLHIVKSPRGTLLPCLPSSLLAFKVIVSEGESKIVELYLSDIQKCSVNERLARRNVYSKKQGDGGRT